MRILITGGAGFIGSHLCEKYVQDKHYIKDKHTVICLDNFLSGNINNIRHLLDQPNFKLVRGDIRDKDTLKEVMHNVDVVFHMAAQVHVDRSYIEPELTYEINVMGTHNILELARLHDVTKIIYASSSEVYGSTQISPMTESHPLDAPHPYGASKTAADRMCYAYAQTFGMDIRVIRTFNIYGPRQKDYGYGGVISLFVKRVLNNQSPIVYGNGLQTRDYTYIDDIVEAYDRTLKFDGKIDGPINIGSGREVTILDLAKLIIRICKSGVEPVHMVARPGEVLRLIADNSRAREILVWTPETNFVTGLKKYIEWYKTFGTEEKIVIS